MRSVEAVKIPGPYIAPSGPITGLFHGWSDTSQTAAALIEDDAGLIHQCFINEWVITFTSTAVGRGRRFIGDPEAAAAQIIRSMIDPHIIGQVEDHLNVKASRIAAALEAAGLLDDA